VAGITTVVEQTNLINNEGFTLIEVVGVMKDDKDVHEMAKQLAQCMVADRHVNLSTVTIKHLKGLVYWVNNHTLHQQPITVANFTFENR
jgi:hypothetical protein